MPKYAPALTWRLSERAVELFCGQCDFHLSSTASVAAARAHVLAHPKHTVAMVVRTLTFVTLDRNTADSFDFVVPAPESESSGV